MAPTPPDSVLYNQRDWYAIGRFALLHLACFGAIWTGFSLKALGIFVAVYAIQMFAITAVYHRHFSHRTFKMGRVARFIGAFLAQTSGQRSVFWWAATHRHHHRYSDTPTDLHSPRQGFWWSHVGWMFSNTNDATRFKLIPELKKDLEAHAELRLLHTYQYIPVAIAAALCAVVAGWAGFVAFCWAMVATYHVTFTINSLSHVWGSQRYDTGDDSRNNPLLAMLTFGEGWHNNHHRFPASARQGVKWWEIDMTWYGLLLLEKLRIIWDLKRSSRKNQDETAPQRTA